MGCRGRSLPPAPGGCRVYPPPDLPAAGCKCSLSPGNCLPTATRPIPRRDATVRSTTLRRRSPPCRRPNRPKSMEITARHRPAANPSGGRRTPVGQQREVDQGPGFADRPATEVPWRRSQGSRAERPATDRDERVATRAVWTGPTTNPQLSKPATGPPTLTHPDAPRPLAIFLGSREVQAAQDQRWKTTRDPARQAHGPRPLERTRPRHRLGPWADESVLVHVEGRGSTELRHGARGDDRSQRARSPHRNAT